PFRRAAISAVVCPDTPQLRRWTLRPDASRAQYSYWLWGFGCSGYRRRTAGSGSHRGAPAVIESPRAAISHGCAGPRRVGRASAGLAGGGGDREAVPEDV